MVAVTKDSQSDGSAYRPGMFDTTCNLRPGMPWVKWCPIDIILWAFLFIIVILVCWKTYISNKSRSDSSGNRLRWPNRSRYTRLQLSYPDECPDSPFNPYHDYVSDSQKLEESASEATMVDPYLMNRDLDKSLLSQFPQISIPSRIRDRKSVKRLTGIGLGIHLDFESQESANILGSWKYKKTDEVLGKSAGNILSTPPPLYLRSPLHST